MNVSSNCSCSGRPRVPNMPRVNSSNRTSMFGFFEFVHEMPNDVVLVVLIRWRRCDPPHPLSQRLEGGLVSIERHAFAADGQADAGASHLLWTSHRPSQLMQTSIAVDIRWRCSLERAKRTSRITIDTASRSSGPPPPMRSWTTFIDSAN